MRRAIHILAGSLALVLGYVALLARKGGKPHRTSGTLFVHSMLVMATAGLLVAAIEGVARAINIPMALLACYLVVTALGVEALARGGGRAGMPAPLVLAFGGIALMAAGGDFRILRSAPLPGTARLARHLWRMCLALLIAALSFFIGQSDELPEAMRIMPLLALPVVFVLAATIFWRWRIRAVARWRLRAD
jgi:uncharacterized membrane protein